MRRRCAAVGQPSTSSLTTSSPCPRPQSRSRTGLRVGEVNAKAVAEEAVRAGEFGVAEAPLPVQHQGHPPRAPRRILSVQPSNTGQGAEGNEEEEEKGRCRGAG